MFRRVELAAIGRFYDLAELDPDIDWPGAMDAYYADHDELGTGPDARGPKLLQIVEEQGGWRVRQVFDDPAGDHDWGISAEVDLAASDDEGIAVIRVTAVDRL